MNNLDKISELNEEIPIYYGTRDNNLNVEYFLNPDHPNNCIFEFGKGVYFTTDEKIANDYIKRDSLIKYAKCIGSSKSGKDIEKVGKRHEYKIDIIKLYEEQGDKVLKVDRSNIKKVLVDVITAYSNNGLEKGYKPKEDFTIGTLIGKSWDNFWFVFLEEDKYGNKNEEKLTNLTKEDIEEIVSILYEQPYMGKQICIHTAATTRNGVNEMKYFDSRYMTYTKAVDISYYDYEEGDKDGK